MNKHFRKICLIILITIIYNTLSFACLADKTVTVDENTKVKHVDRVMYGINQEWAITNNSYYIGDVSLKAKSAFVNCYKDSIGLARMAGTSADWVKWKNNLGEVSDRMPNKIWGINGIVRFGMLEWLNAIRAADRNAKFTYVVNIISDSYENMADAIELLSGDGSVNYNGGVNWAKVRMDYGIKEPVDIYVYEIGNETDTKGGGGLSLDEYIERAKKAIDVIRSIKPDAKIAVHNYTGNTTENVDYYDHRLLKELGNDIDYITFHGYYFPDGETGSDTVRAMWQHEDRVRRMSESIKRITGSDRIKIYQSEHACNRYSSDTTAGYNYVFPHTMKGTMLSAEWFLRMMWYPQVEAATYHSTHSSSWCIAYPEDNDIKMSAIGSLLQMMLKYGVGDVVKSEMTDFEKGVTADAAGQIVKNEEGLNVILVNKNGSPVDFSFDFKNRYTVRNIAYIKADDYKADNYIGSKDIEVEWNAERPSGVFENYEADKYSITFITLEEAAEEAEQ